MDIWNFAEQAELALAVAKAGDGFQVRRALQRLERGEIGIETAIKLVNIAASRSDWVAPELAQCAKGRQPRPTA
jgi:hypothetical protein